MGFCRPEGKPGSVRPLYCRKAEILVLQRKALVRAKGLVRVDRLQSGTYRPAFCTLQSTVPLFDMTDVTPGGDPVATHLLGAF